MQNYVKSGPGLLILFSNKVFPNKVLPSNSLVKVLCKFHLLPVLILIDNCGDYSEMSC